MNKLDQIILEKVDEKGKLQKPLARYTKLHFKN
jgi:hypothetical protein